MVASLWSGSWFVSQLPLNQIEATAPKCAKNTLRHLLQDTKARNERFAELMRRVAELKKQGVTPEEIQKILARYPFRI